MELICACLNIPWKMNGLMDFSKVKNLFKIKKQNRGKEMFKK